MREKPRKHFGVIRRCSLPTSSKPRSGLRSLAKTHPSGSEVFEGISWVFPDRALTAELQRALEHGRLRGADLWHVACALYLDPTASELVFLSLDVPQQRTAAALGFKTP